MDEKYDLTADKLKDLFKFGARETIKLARQRDYLLKFAQAVEMLPALEKAGWVKFPLQMSMAQKAHKLAEKSSEELNKLAFVAKRMPEEMGLDKIASEDALTVSFAQKYGKLTQRFLEGID